MKLTGITFFPVIAKALSFFSQTIFAKPVNLPNAGKIIWFGATKKQGKVSFCLPAP